MLEILLFDLDPFVPERFHRFIQVYGIPQDNRCHYEIQPTGPIALILVGAISDLAQTIGEDRSCQPIARFAFVESHLHPSAQRWTLQPLEGKQTFLHPSNFSQRPGQPILSGIGGKLVQDQ